MKSCRRKLIKMQMDFSRQAVELLHWMAEVENFYPLNAWLRSGLERWIIRSQHQQAENILEWVPRDSEVTIYTYLLLSTYVYHTVYYTLIMHAYLRLGAVNGESETFDRVSR